MRLVNVSAPKQQAFDRNPTVNVQNDNNGARAPSALVQRILYTVPANRKALIDGILAKIMRATAAAPVGLYYTEISTTVIAATAYLIWNDSLDNTVGAYRSTSLANVGVLPAAAFIENSQIDNSTGGTVSYTAGIKVTEFDA